MAWKRQAWAKMPTNWIIRENGLRNFNGEQTGTAVAALKILLAIVSETRQEAPDDGPRAYLSYTQLQEITGLSRSMISPGLQMLRGLVKLEHGKGRENGYSIVGFPEPGAGGWAMIPTARLRKQGVLKAFSPRSTLDLAALKLYLLLASFRDVRSGEASISYEKIGEYTGLDRNDVSRAMSRLIDLDLVRVRSGRDKSDNQNFGYNRYILLGLAEPQAKPGSANKTDETTGLDFVDVSDLKVVSESALPF